MLAIVRKVVKEGKRLLIFSQMTRLLDICEVVLRDAGFSFLRIDGSTPVLERQGLIRRFDKHVDIPVFLLSTRAGGVGINLTAASEVLFLESSFNPQIDRQAEDRAHRIGQEKEVNVYRVGNGKFRRRLSLTHLLCCFQLISNQTIDEEIYRTHQRKAAMADELLGAAASEEDEEDVKDILRRVLQPLLDGHAPGADDEQGLESD